MTVARAADPMCIWQGEVAVDGGVLPLCMAGDGPPVILLHGWTLDHRMWEPQVEALAEEFFLIAPDRRGFGQATAPADLSREAEDVIAIADSLGLGRFALIGLSQGATIALDVARRFGARLTGLVVSGAPLPGLVEREEMIDLARMRALAEAGDLTSLRAQWARHPLMATRTPEAAALMAAILADYDGRDLLVPANTPDLPREALSLLAMPVLAMTGIHDTSWRKACAQALGHAVPRGMHGLVPDAGHLANVDNPERFNALVGAFLRSCAPPQARPLS
jgi:pimeloyl-ACP methyl ester carboxylesterase